MRPKAAHSYELTSFRAKLAKCAKKTIQLRYSWRAVRSLRETICIAAAGLTDTLNRYWLLKHSLTGARFFRPRRRRKVPACLAQCTDIQANMKTMRFSPIRLLRILTRVP